MLSDSASSSPIVKLPFPKPNAPYSTIHDALCGKNIWLSGGVGAIGMSIAQTALDYNCASLQIVDIHPPSEGNVSLSKLMKPTSTKLIYEQVDVTDRAAVEKSIRPDHDVIICGAGIANEKDVKRTMNVNCMGVYNCIQSTLSKAPTEGSKIDKEKCIIVIASAAGVFPFHPAPAYSMSKFAVVGYSSSVARKAWKRGVRIVTLCPTVVDGGMGLWADTNREHVKTVGILKRNEVSLVIMELIRRRDLVARVVYMSETAGVRFAEMSIRKPLNLKYAKL